MINRINHANNINTISQNDLSSEDKNWQKIIMLIQEISLFRL